MGFSPLTPAEESTAKQLAAFLPARSVCKARETNDTRDPAHANKTIGRQEGSTLFIDDGLRPARAAGGLDQAEPAEARMALLADDDVVVDHGPERLALGHDLLGHLDIGL